METEGEDFGAPGEKLWRGLGWQPSTHQIWQLLELQQQLKYWNTQVNLSRLVDGTDFWVTQVFDSLWPLRRELESATCLRYCIDVGTGGGLPGLIAAIALPGAQLTLVESVGRKTAAITEIIRSLGLLERVQIRTERVERTGRDPGHRNSYDLAMARAVAAAPVVAEYLIPLLRLSGEAILFLGHWSETDARKLADAITPLQARLCLTERQYLPAGCGLRHQIRLRPLQPCPVGFPRAVGRAVKQPLGVRP